MICSHAHYVFGVNLMLFFFKKKIKNIELGADYIIENRPVNSVDFLLFFLIIFKKSVYKKLSLTFDGLSHIK